MSFISGFTFVRNANKLYIPIKQSIISILPIVDEYVIAVGKGDADDNTLANIKAIESDKIKIIETKWETEKYPKNTIYAQQTDIAKDACSGKWLFYLQGDEAIHENQHDYIFDCINKADKKPKIEALAFKYLHFWGDYHHYHFTHNWYQKEIRIIKNLQEIHSFSDAQSFRSYKHFNGNFEDYQNRDNSRLLRTAEINAHVYHYGYVRPPELMTYKRQSSFTSYHGINKAEQLLSKQPKTFDYGPLQKLYSFTGSHPKSMEDWISKFDWKEKLQYHGHRNKNRPIHKHEKIKYRAMGWIEQNILGGKTIGGIKNFKTIAKF